MALNNKPRGRVWSRLHFLVRFVGLTGLLAAVAGVVVLASFLATLPSEEEFLAWVQNEAGTDTERVGAWLIAGSGSARMTIVRWLPPKGGGAETPGRVANTGRTAKRALSWISPLLLSLSKTR